MFITRIENGPFRMHSVSSLSLSQPEAVNVFWSEPHCDPQRRSKLLGILKKLLSVQNSHWTNANFFVLLPCHKNCANCLFAVVKKSSQIVSNRYTRNVSSIILAMISLTWGSWQSRNREILNSYFCETGSCFGCCDATTELVAPVRILYRIFGCECFMKFLNFHFSQESWFGTKSIWTKLSHLPKSLMSDVRLDRSQGVFDIQFMYYMLNKLWCNIRSNLSLMCLTFPEKSQLLAPYGSFFLSHFVLPLGSSVWFGWFFLAWRQGKTKGVPRQGVPCGPFLGQQPKMKGRGFNVLLAFFGKAHFLHLLWGLRAPKVAFLDDWKFDRKKGTR